MKIKNSIAEITSRLLREHLEKTERQGEERAAVNALLVEMRRQDKDTGWIHAFERWRKLNVKQRMKYLPRSEVQ